MKRYLEDRIQSDLKRKVVILTGPRQVGKTYLSRQLARYFKNPIYLNWDVPQQRVVLQNQSWDHRHDFIIMDEIHKMKDWKKWLKGVTDAKSPETALLVTGSARMETFRQTGESLAGRYFSYTLHPISVKELCDHTMVSPHQAFDQILERGGFPEPCLEDSAELAQRWRMQYSQDLIREDILEFSRIHEINAMKLFVEILRDRVGSPLSLLSIGRDIGISSVTLTKYLDILEALFVVFTIHPWHSNIARSLSKAPKVYFYDQGLVRGDIGAKLENALGLMLRRHCDFQRDAKGVASSLHYIRTKDGAEIDFAVAENQALTHLIECKSSDQSPHASLAHFAKRFPTVKAIQLVANLRTPHISRGIHIQNLANYLAALSA